MIEASETAKLPTRYGDFTIQAFRDSQGFEHMAAYMGDVSGEAVPVRIHSQCLTGDTLYSLKCDCGGQLEEALKFIGENRRGVLVYLAQEGRGIGLFNKINAYNLQDNGADTVDANNKLGFPADMRDYKIAGDILDFLGVKSVRLLTNNRDKITSLRESSIQVVDRIPLRPKPNIHNEKYLKTKIDRLNHIP